MEGQIFNVPKAHVKNCKDLCSGLSQLEILMCVDKCLDLVKALTKYRCYFHNLDKVYGDATHEEIRASIVKGVVATAVSLGVLADIFNITQEEIENEVRRKACFNEFDQSDYVYKSDRFINVSKVRKNVETFG